MRGRRQQLCRTRKRFLARAIKETKGSVHCESAAQGDFSLMNRRRHRTRHARGTLASPETAWRRYILSGVHAFMEVDTSRAQQRPRSDPRHHRILISSSAPFQELTATLDSSPNA